jgi:hypothetical protein
MFDAANLKKFRRIVRNASSNDSETVIVDMNHRQLGFTDIWLQRRIKSAKSTVGEAETDFLNIWADGSNASPFSKHMLSKLKDGIVDEPRNEITEAGYIIRWYYPEDELKNEQLIMGLDTSDAVGKDDIALVIRRASNAEVVGVAQVNETNTIKFARWMSALLVTFPKAILIYERRATGTAIGDYIMDYLSSKGVNPYTKLFNWIVQDKSSNLPRYITMENNGMYEDYQDAHRTETGFATSAFGRAARDKLYGVSMKKSMEFTHNKVFDKKLVGQITNLTIRNNRIDHSSGKKDDLVIAWLLGYWFLEFAKNVDFYGWDKNKVLSEVRYNTSETEEDRHNVDRAKRTKEKIAQLMITLNEKDDEFSINMIVNKVVKLKASLKDEAEQHLNIENALKETLMIKKKTAQSNDDYVIVDGHGMF